MGIIMAMVRSCHRSNEWGQLGNFLHRDVFSMTSRSKYTKTGQRKEEETHDYYLLFSKCFHPALGAVQSKGDTVQVALPS